MGPFVSVAGVVKEIMRLHRSLPPRPSLDEIEAAMTLVRNADVELQVRINAILKQNKGFEVPDELFSLMQEMQKNAMRYQSIEQKREALKLLDLENVHALFDDFVQRASGCLPSSSSGFSPSISESTASVIPANSKGYSDSVSALLYSEKQVLSSTDRVTKDDSSLKMPKWIVDEKSSNSHLSTGLVAKSTTKQEVAFGE